MAVVDTYAVANYSLPQSFNPDFTGSAQSFTGNGSQLDSVDVYIRRSGTPTGNVTINIYAHSGTFGTTSVPTGSALAASSLVAASLPTTLTMVTFVFAGPNRMTLTNATKYVVAVENAGSGFASNFIELGYDNTSPSHAGSYSYFEPGTGWVVGAAYDTIFTVNGSTSKGSMLAMFM